jgi:acetate---CoA ligase (ADP-forming)
MNGAAMDDHSTGLDALFRPASVLVVGSSEDTVAAPTARGVAACVVISSGSVEPAAGGRGAGSRTGALAQVEAVVDAFLLLFLRRRRRHGIVRARDPRDLGELARVFARPKRPRGPRVGMATNSAGLGVLLSDECVRHDLATAAFTPATLNRLRAVVPKFDAVQQPIDVTAQLLGNSEPIAGALGAVAADPEVDVVPLALGILGEYYDLNRILADVVAVDATIDRPVVVCWVTGQPGMVQRLAAPGIPAFDDATGCARAVGRLVEHTAARPRLRNAPPASTPEEIARRRTRALGEYAGKNLFRSWGLAVCWPVTSTRRSGRLPRSATRLRPTFPQRSRTRPSSASWCSGSAAPRSSPRWPWSCSRPPGSTVPLMACLSNRC